MATVDRDEAVFRIQLEGALSIATAAEVKTLLLEGLASGKVLQVDLARAEQIDITLLQLFWAAGREAAHQGGGIVDNVPEAAVIAARDAGFERFPGSGDSGVFPNVSHV